MPVTPWQRPNFVQERLPGSSAWTNPAGALGDGTVTTVPLNTNLSTQLLLQDFRFNIPADATIDGIEVQITRKVVGGAVEQSSRWVSGYADRFTSFGYGLTASDGGEMHGNVLTSTRHA